VIVTGNGSLLSREAYIAAFAKDFENLHSIRLRSQMRFHWLPSTVIGSDVSSAAQSSSEELTWPCGAKWNAAGSCGQSYSSHSHARTLPRVKATAGGTEQRLQNLNCEVSGP
jgi:hypothetical protein